MTSPSTISKSRSISRALPDALRQRLTGEDAERGAVLMIVALMLTVMMLCAGFAIDFGSWYSRAEKLQNAADAAALAGAAEFELYTVADANGDRTSGQPTEEARGKAQARVLDVLAQNGIFNDADTEILVSFPLEFDNQLGEVSVRVTDRDVDLYFSTFVIDNFTLSRDAKAQVDKCGNQCSNTVAVPEPFAEIDASGSGDGFTPIYIDKRMYAINHHTVNPDIVCISFDTQLPCDNDGDPDIDSHLAATAYPLPVMPVAGTPAFRDNYGSGNSCTYHPVNNWDGCYPSNTSTYDPLLTDNLVLTTVAGSRIYLVGSLKNNTALVCWETDLYSDGDPTTDPIGGPCPNSPAIINNSPRVVDNARYETRGGSVTFVPDDGSNVDGRIFVFTDDHKVHCRLTTSLQTPCTGYGAAGLDTGLGPSYDAAPSMNSEARGVWAQADRIYDDATKRIYTVAHFGYASSTTRPWGVRLICWDAQNDEPCDNFGEGSQYSSEIHRHNDRDFSQGRSRRQAGRLFFNRDTSGGIIGICSTGHDGLRYGNSWNAASGIGLLDTDCVDLNGENRFDFNDFDNAANPQGSYSQTNGHTGADSSFLGTHYYHANSNKLIVNRGYTNDPPTHCWSFGDASASPPVNPGYCGNVYAGDTEDYGYSSLGDCLFALGDNKIFYTFNSGMQDECREGRVTSRIFPCVCYNGDKHWGSVIMQVPDFDPYEALLVYVKANEFDTDAQAIEEFDLLQTDGVIDLDTVSTDYPLLYIDIVVRTKEGENPWTDNMGVAAPMVTVGYSDKPFLVN